MNVLITGGAGYIGSLLTELLLLKGYDVTVVDNLSYNQLSLLHVCGNKKFKLISGDVMDYVTNENFINGFDVIIPLAAIVGAGACDKYKNLATEVNFLQIKEIVTRLKKNQKLIMPNTDSQYGSSTEVVTEESPVNPLSHYARTKCEAEKYILEHGNGVCLRLATVFGSSPRMRKDLLVNDFVYKALVDGYLVLFESYFKRNYVHVRDVCKAFLFAIENYDKMNNDKFNVGLSSANMSKMELALKVKEHIPKLVIKTEEFSEDVDKRNYVVSNAKLEKLGWSADYSLDDGIQELIYAHKMVININNKLFTNI